MDPSAALGSYPAPTGISKDNMETEHLNNELPNSMEQVADSCSAGQGMPHVLQKPNVRCHVDKNLILLTHPVRNLASSSARFL